MGRLIQGMEKVGDEKSKKNRARTLQIETDYRVILLLVHKIDDKSGFRSWGILPFCFVVYKDVEANANAIHLGSYQNY